MKTLIPALLLLCVPAAASALELRHDPADAGCSEDTPQNDAAAHKWTGQLGGPNTRRAWRALLDAGPHGCDAVAAWLQQGAPAAPDSEVAGAVLGLARSGSADNVSVVVLALSHPSDAVTAAALFGLRSRLPVLQPDHIDWLLAAATRTWVTAEDAPDPRTSALGLLLGRHAEGRVQYVQDGPVSVPEWVETRTWSAPDLPDLHREALVRLLEAGDPAAARAFAELALAMANEEHPVASALGPLLVPLLQRVGPDRPTAQWAAQALGRTQADGVDAAVEAALTQRNPPYLAPHLLNGFEDRIKQGPVDAGMAARLERLRGVVVPRSGRRAERLRKRVEQKLR